jgi:uncharacterized protein (DUF1684 family)
MKTHLTLLFFFSFGCSISFGQQSYVDSLKKYQQDYVKGHDVVKGNDKQAMHFFPVNANYRVNARFERTEDSPWFGMKTSGTKIKAHRIYGVLHFAIHDTVVKLNAYQSEELMKMPEYTDYLFLPFTDATSGEESYTNGRYIDLRVNDIVNDHYTIDFNKAYNPYCAYVSGKYNCPIPPPENTLPVAIRAGEMVFTKSH